MFPGALSHLIDSAQIRFGLRTKARQRRALIVHRLRSGGDHQNAGTNHASSAGERSWGRDLDDRRLEWSGPNIVQGERAGRTLR